MSEAVPVERLWSQIRRTPEVRAAVLEATKPHDESHPRVGDLFVIAETADSGLEWLVVAVADQRGCLDVVQIVPADTGWLAGRADVVLSASFQSADVGPLIVRCAHAATVPASRLASANRTGFLSADAVGQVLAKLRQLDEAAPEAEIAATTDEAEAEADPEYRHWNQQILDRAVRLLTPVMVPVLLAATMSWAACGPAAVLHVPRLECRSHEL